jgi:hypothetical protein
MQNPRSDREAFTELLLKLPPSKRSGIHNLLSSDAAEPTLLRANLNTLWPEFRDLADPGFVKKFATEPNQRAWEMQVAVALRRSNIELTAPTPGCGPDFLAHDRGNKVWFEAVTAHGGRGDDRVPQTADRRLIVDRETEDKIVLRLTNAITEKVRKLETFIEKGVVADCDRYVIALCSAIPHYVVSAYHVARAVFAIGGWELERDAKAQEPVSGYLRHQGLVRKASGRGVPTDGFLTSTWQRVNAVLFACGAFPLDTSQLGKEFATVHNSVAVNSLRWGWLRFHVDYRVTVKDGQRFLTRVYGRSGVRLPP